MFSELARRTFSLYQRNPQIKASENGPIIWGK